ncbi:GNAT family N-acetyltransferase [Schumannella luteola]|uniref:Phosphinothricin acetyltransferase n=1 Tax=Schumannella luteola TaxID=472059 RepID=A0A852YI68_9MICO|nr:GNAT family N-acetyltransferase [Schumannella luteola]NYG97469.1 phosphinothricin acetyltransferase [Schumannella luteola]
MVESDWDAVHEIYRAGISTGNATFESEPPTWQQFDASRRRELRLVATDESGGVVGWAAVSSVSARSVYAGVVEHSVYVHPDRAARGIGRALIDQLVAQAPDAGVWTIQSSIFPENTASIRLHANAGFRTVGSRERIALMTYGPHEGQWRDTILIEWRARADH